MIAAPQRRLALEPLDVDEDAELLHGWVTHPRSVYWQMGDADLADVRREYASIAAEPHHHAWLGRVDGAPTFLAETYDPRRDPCAGLADRAGELGLQQGDLGMHVLVAPPAGEPVPGLTRAVFGAVMAHCLRSEAVRRVVVEPDARNEPILALNAAAGFVVDREVELPGKTAALSFCTRAAFEESDLCP